MTRGYLWSIVGGILLLSSAASSSAIEVGVDQSQTWSGFMNWFELPENGSGYVGGGVWGTADLTASFSGSTLTLGPNSVNDPAPYWYTPEGGPGSTGNKIMDANFYVEPIGSLPGQTVTFSGTVLTDTLTDDVDAKGNGWTAVAFIKDFAANYSSHNLSTIPLTPGAFTLSLDTIDDPTRHVQYGFTVTGPNVWITDAGQFGTITIATLAPEGVTGDYNDNDTVDAADYTVWRDNLGGTTVLPNDPAGGTIGATQYDNWKANFGQSPPGGAAVASAVPEPASCVMLLMALGAVACGRRFRR